MATLQLDAGSSRRGPPEPTGAAPLLSAQPGRTKADAVSKIIKFRLVNSGSW